MLESLSISNFILIDQAEIIFQDDFCVLSGETGAGKSIILHAIQFVLGARADTKFIRANTHQMSIVAVFDIQNHHDAQAYLSDLSLLQQDSSEKLLLRRTLTIDGKSQIFINDHRATLQSLKALGLLLVEIQGQFSQTCLFDNKTHKLILNQLIENKSLEIETSDAFQQWKSFKKQEGSLEKDIIEGHDLHAHNQESLKVLETLQPQPHEEALLQEQIQCLKKSRITQDQISSLLSEFEQNTLLHTLQGFLSVLDQTSDSNESLQQAKSCLERACVEIEEASNYLQQSITFEEDFAGLDKLEDRLHQFKKLSRQYHILPDQLSDLYQELIEKTDLYEQKKSMLTKTKISRQHAEENFYEWAQKLSFARKESCTPLINNLQNNLYDLKLEKTVFEIDIQRLPKEKWNADGIDEVTFKVSTNPGTAPKPLKEVASGGELSRFMLALRSVITQNLSISCLIFDEIDLGVGGETATAIGRKLLELGKNKQVIVITHSPQVAALGTYHWHIEKRSTKDNTVSQITYLDFQKRCLEIARMLSGDELTEDARKAALSLLNEGRKNELPKAS